jgi:hypothetical protein
VTQLDTLAAAAQVPADCIPTDAVLIVSFLDPDGDPCYRVMTGGDCQVSNTIGLLHMAAHSLAHDANPTPCEQDDD